MQGDEIKEGQVIGYLHQLGTELPVTVRALIAMYPSLLLRLPNWTHPSLLFVEQSDVAGEVLKLLSDDGGKILCIQTFSLNIHSL